MKIFLLVLFINCFLFNSYAQQKVDVIFRIDDFGKDNEEFYPKLFDLFEKYNSKIVLAVVPFHYKPGHTERQKEILKNGLERGIVEIAQHGYSHDVEMVNGYPVNEFIGVPFRIQYENIKKGKEYLEKEYNVKIKTFIPPQNQYDESTIQALESLNFQSISAGLNNKPVSSGSRLNFIPFTTTLWDFCSAVENAKKHRSEHDVVIVIMTHDFEFADNIAFYKKNEDFKKYNTPMVGTLTLAHFEKILKLVNTEENFVVTTFDKLEIDKNLISEERFNNSTENYLFRIPGRLYLSSSGYFPSDDNNFLKYKMYPVMIILLYIITGILSAILVRNFYNRVFNFQKRLILAVLLLILINTAAVILFLSEGFLGPNKIMLIASANPFLLVLILNDLRMKRTIIGSLQTAAEI